MGSFTQRLMGHAKIVGTANQVHAGVQRLEARSRVPTFAGQASQSFSEGRIQPFNKCCIEDASPAGELEQLLRLSKQSMSQSFA